ncbi:response regulator transcription factor [Bacillus solitudinis]|uniref:response regulator transcription factor n=2 Tax=Bacillus solitudinis TaxID=2014074 RepID=UPI000C24CC1D|nr:response regulator [Bacillus solitudinis]
MYNIIIVDDEPVIRSGLKASVEWDKEGLSLLGDFSNGEEAFSIMKENHVDILITDIKMPIMDGLTLMKKALNLYPKLIVILISSYNEFAYVKEGIKYGAIDYVLKPTLEQEEFLQLIQKCVKRLDEEQSIKKKLTLVDQTTTLRERKMVEQKLKRVLLNDNDTTHYEEVKKLMSGSILVIYMKMNDVANIEEQYGGLFKSFILEEIQEHFYTKYEEGVCLTIWNADLVFFMNVDHAPAKTIHQLNDEMVKKSGLSFSFGYDVITDLSEADKGFKQSALACERRFFHPKDIVFSYKESKEKSFNRFDAKLMKQFLLPTDEKKVATCIEERYEQWKQEEIQPSEIKQEACDLLTNLFGSKLTLSLLLDKCEDIKKTESLNEMYSALIKQIAECILLITKLPVKTTKDNELMESALSYIHHHYTSELTLQMVADHIHISRNYFSILFKQFRDQKFIDYVIELRIKKATELLMNTSLKVYEVAARSGFKDVKYFSKLFKRITGYSPVDFRTEHQE